MTRNATLPLVAVLLATTLIAVPALAQVVSSAADNDMTPTLADDGWTGTFFTISPPVPPDFQFGRAGEYHYQKPPDGNNYAGADTTGSEMITKTISGLTSGTQYAVELYWGTAVAGGFSLRPEAFFEVTFCGTTLETRHSRLPESEVVFVMNGEWVEESLSFTANADSCALSFRSRGILATPPHPSGIGGNAMDWLLLDSVQVSVATSTDFGIVAFGPSTFFAAGSTEPVSVTVENLGPSEGTAPVVTYKLPLGVSVSGGSLASSGPDAANWSCVGDLNAATITCTRARSLVVGSTSSFSFDIDLIAPPDAFAGLSAVPGAGVAPRVSKLGVSPTFQTGTVDPNPGNNYWEFTTTFVDDDVDECALGTQQCAPGQVCFNVVGGYGCHDPCPIGYRDDVHVGCADIDECAEGTNNCDPNATCTNTDGWFRCACNVGYRGRGESCTADPACGPGTDCNVFCGDAVIAGSESCDDGNETPGDGCDASCATEPGWVCSGAPSHCDVAACGDGIAVCDESCDDGNAESGDGCSESCTVESGYACQGTPSACTRLGCDADAGGCALESGVLASRVTVKDRASFACNSQPGAPGNLATLCLLGLLGLVLARRRHAR